MPYRAKLFIASVGVSGAVVMAGALSRWNSHDVDQFLFLFVLALIGSALKVRLPGITGTYSLSFWFVLLAVASLSFSSTVLIAAAAAAVQVLWKPKSQPTAVQLLFNVANLVLSAAAAYGTHNVLVLPGAGYPELGLLSLTVVIYWIVNTGLVSAVLTLLHGGSFRQIWNHWCFLSLPYYLVGAATAGLVIPVLRKGHWLAILVVLPFMLLASCWHRVWAERHARMT